VQILEHYQQRLHLRLAEHDALEGVERALATLWRVKTQEGAVVRQGVQ
jgi:hypothetical protein